MRFLIHDGKPYLCSGGRVYPVAISGDAVTIDEERGELSNDKGRYTLTEIHAKLGYECSSIKRKRSAREV